MNRRISFLTVLAVIAAIFAMTTVVLADAPVATLGGNVDVYVGDEITASVTAGTVIQWYKNGNAISGATREVLVHTVASEGASYFYATVDGVKSNTIKVVAEKKILYTAEPIIFDFGDDVFRANSVTGVGSTLSTEYDAELGKMVLKAVTTKKDTNITFKNLGVDFTTYKYVAYRIKSPYEEIGDSEWLVYNFYDSMTKPTYSTGKNYYMNYYYDYYPKYTANEWVFISGNLFDDDANDKYSTYNGGRVDFYNDAKAVGDEMHFDHMAFFATEADRNAYIASLTKTFTPSYKSWNFANDNAFAADFFMDEAEVVDGGIKLAADTSYNLSLMTRDKFDLSKYSIVKVFYSGDVTEPKLVLTNNGTEYEIPYNGEDGYADLTNAWDGEFSNISIKSTEDVTIFAIVFFETKADVNQYDITNDIKECTCDESCACGGVCERSCQCVTEAEYEDAIWWNFADTRVKNNVQPLNATVKYNAVTDDTKAYTEYTAKKDGDVTLTYNDTNMISSHRFVAEEYPFVVIGYNGSYTGTEAFIEFTTGYNKEPVTVSFAIDDENLKTANGYKMIELNLSSLGAMKMIDENVSAEFRGVINSVELGFKDAKAGETIDIAYIVFFNDEVQAGLFDGKVILPPSESVAGSWVSKSKVKSEYIKVKDLDMEAEKVQFNLSDYSRISRLTLNELKRDYANTLITANGEGYRYEFYPSKVSSDMKTWYYDLDAHFEAGFSGDIYRETIKSLVTEEIGTYLGGVHFVQKFVKDTSFPFSGKFIFEIGEELEGKHLDIYKYDPATNTIALAEHAPVKNGMMTITTLGGDIAIVDSNYQPGEDELARAAIETLESTAWDAHIWDFSADGDTLVEYKATNAKVETKKENGITYKRTTSTTEDQRIEAVFTPAKPFEASEYPVMLVKYRTSANMQGSVANYISTSFYEQSSGGDDYNGYAWLKNASYYSATDVYSKSTNWTTKLINYTDMASMKASGLPVSIEHIENGGAKIASGTAYPFKGELKFYRLDFNVGPVGTVVDFAYVAFFKTEEEAKKYMDARNAVDNYHSAESKTEVALTDYVIFDMLDKNETAKFVLHSGSEKHPVKTETKNTAEGFWGKDADGEFNYTRTLAEEEIFSLADYPVLKIKAKFSIGGVNTQFYVWQDNQTGSPRANIVIDKANEWTEQIWDFSSGKIAKGTWDGNLTKLRIDPMRGAGAVEREATIEYIGFFKSVEAAEAFTSVEDAEKVAKEEKK